MWTTPCATCVLLKNSCNGHVLPRYPLYRVFVCRKQPAYSMGFVDVCLFRVHDAKLYVKRSQHCTGATLKYTCVSFVCRRSWAVFNLFVDWQVSEELPASGAAALACGRVLLGGGCSIKRIRCGDGGL